MFKAKFPALTGILTLAYFIHNCILSIMRNQEKPKNNVSVCNKGWVLTSDNNINTKQPTQTLKHFCNNSNKAVRCKGERTGRQGLLRSSRVREGERGSHASLKSVNHVRLSNLSLGPAAKLSSKLILVKLLCQW